MNNLREGRKLRLLDKISEGSLPSLCNINMEYRMFETTIREIELGVSKQSKSDLINYTIIVSERRIT